jgi:integrase/recombinase XerC
MSDSIRTKAGENYLTETEEKSLFNHLSRLKDRQAERDYVLLKTMRLLGLRRVEVVSLDVADVFRKEKLVIDSRIAAKGATGELDIPLELQKIYSHFFTLKRAWKEAMTDDAPLFVSRNGKRLGLRTVNDLVEKWSREVGIRITPHGFRHTKGRRIMDDERYMTPAQKCKALNFANRQLRHKSMTSTLVYTQPTKEEMALVAGI